MVFVVVVARIEPLEIMTSNTYICTQMSDAFLKGTAGAVILVVVLAAGVRLAVAGLFEAEPVAG